MRATEVAQLEHRPVQILLPSNVSSWTPHKKCSKATDVFLNCFFFLATIDIFNSSNYAGQECEICCSLLTDSNWVLCVRFLEIKNPDPEWGTLSVQHLAWHHTNTGRIDACAFFLQCSTHAWARGRVSVLYGKNVCTSSVGSRKQCWVESCIWSMGTCAVNRPLSTSHSLFHPVLFLWLPYLLPAKQTPSLLLTISSLIPTGVALPLAAEAYLQRKKN